MRVRPHLASALASLLAAALLLLAASATHAATPLRAPAAPPVRVCGNAALLRGPATPPAGAVRVATSQNLDQLSDAHPAGTTFWLSPGVHTLGRGIYDQVIPKDGNTYVGAPGAVLDGQQRNRYAFTQHARGVTIRNLTITGFGRPADNMNEGVVNHDAGTGWRIERNAIVANGGAGIMVGDRNVVRLNCLARNGQYGLSAYKRAGVHGIVVDRNEIAFNNTADWEQRQEGCGCTGGAKFWDVTGAAVTGNYVHHNRGAGLWADTNNAGFRFVGNWFEANHAEALFYEISYNAHIVANTFVRNTIVKGREFAARGDSFPVGSVYLSESGGDARVYGGRLSTLLVARNRFLDNWGGVVLWENADRFCGSDANTSTGYCTRVGAANLRSCVPGRIDSAPLRSDCRWKTQHVRVTGNDFQLRRLPIGCSRFCGQQAIVANYGTWPRWSPYRGRSVQDAIAYRQDNRFLRNRYRGPWRFAHHEPGRMLGWGRWLAAPSRQDAGSTFTP